MTPHILPVALDGDFVMTEWFVRSLQDIRSEDEANGSDMSSICWLYEQTYGVKLRFDEHDWIDGVGFSSEEAAVEFVLRWS